jgi:hypothetical protein
MRVEKWKDIPGFEKYEVSDLGRVRNKKTGTIRKFSNCGSGYKSIVLKKNKKSHGIIIHRLVCTVFNGPPPSDKHHAAHCDGDKLNNTAKNLEWKLPIENAADRQKHGTQTRGSTVATSKLNEATVIVMRNAYDPSRPTESQRELSEQFGITRSNASYIVNRKTWRHI